MSSTYVRQSTVVPASAGTVWDALSKLDFKFWSLVTKADVANETFLSPVVTLTFKDGTVQKLRVLAFSSVDRSLTYEVFESNPPVGYTSAQHTLSVTEVTSTGEAFVTFDASFSSDATPEVIQDAKFKRADALSELKKAFSK